MKMWYLLDDEGHPRPVDINSPESMAQWTMPGARVVLQDRRGSAFISTVFLALNHSFGDGPPVLWETMIFDHPAWSDYQERYSSKSDAILGHLRALALVDLYDRAPRRLRKGLLKHSRDARLGPVERRRVARALLKAGVR
jgi:hypothetical protein